jgi:4-amino-4-deoxy-L-arabinose transferase-like glycosyltransferase
MNLSSSLVEKTLVLTRQERGGDVWVLVAIIFYFVAQMCARVMIGPTLELDEAEAFWYARHFALGYGAQPPLYFWLQWIFFQVLGEGILALAALKAVVFSIGLITVFRTLLVLGFERQVAIVGVLSLGLLPEVVWESQRALTHTVLVLTLTALALRVALNVLTLGRWRDYLAFGLVLGLGLLSKYNFAFNILGLTCALTLCSAWRERGEIWRLAATLGICLTLSLPLVAFAYLSPEKALSSVHKLAMHAGWSPLDPLRYLAAFGEAALGLLALPLVIIGPLAVSKGLNTRDARLVFLWRSALAALVAVLLLGLITGATAVRGRWLMPVVWPLVVAVTVALWIRLADAARRNLALGLSAMWLIAALALPYATLRNPGYRNADFSKLLSIVPAEARVASDSIWVLGNLSLLNPDLELSIVDAGTLPHTLILMKEGTVAKKVGADTPKRFVKIQHGNLVATVVLTGVLN